MIAITVPLARLVTMLLKDLLENGSCQPNSGDRS